MYFTFDFSIVKSQIGDYPQVQEFDPAFNYNEFVQFSDAFKAPDRSAINLELILTKRSKITDIISTVHFPFPYISEKVKNIVEQFDHPGIAFLEGPYIKSKGNTIPYFMIYPVTSSVEALDLSATVFCRYNPSSINPPTQLEKMDSYDQLKTEFLRNTDPGSINPGFLPLGIWKPVFRNDFNADLFALKHICKRGVALFVSSSIKNALEKAQITGYACSVA